MNTSPSVPRRAWHQRIPLTREGLFWLLISLAMLVTGLIKGINLINLLACWVIMLVVWNWWLARRQLRHLHLERSLPDFVFAHTPFRWTVTVANHGRKNAHSITVAEPAAPHAWFVADLPAGQTIALDGEATLPQRGVVAWDQLRLSCGYPVGLANVVREVSRPQELLVLPRLGILQRNVLRHWLSQHSHTAGSVRASPRRQPNAQLEFHGLRSFRPGDSPRHIHWRTSARRGELMVREFEDLPNDNLILIVDPWTPTDVAPGDNTDLERLISLAATIVWEWCRQKGDDFALAVASATPVVRHGVTGRDLAVAMLSELMQLTGSCADAWPPLLDCLEKNEFAAAAVLVLTLRDEAPLGALACCLRRPVVAVQVARSEERAFFQVG